MIAPQLLERALLGAMMEVEQEARDRAEAQSLVRQRPANYLRMTLTEWMPKYRPYLVMDRPFDLSHHPYLRDIYADDHKEIVYLKAAQVGISEYLISWVLYMAAEQDATGFYVMPSDGLVSEFSATRLNPAIDPAVSPELAALVMSNRGRQRGADKVTLKRVGNRFIYFRGGQISESNVGGSRRQHAAQLRSADADALVLDELDELDPRVPPIARARLEHSNIAKVRIASTPTYSDTGIFAAFQPTDQRRWHVPCPHCGLKQPMNLENLVQEWDALGRPLAWNGKDTEEVPYVTCTKCHGRLNREAQGEWVAAYPKRPIHGYHIVGFDSPRKNLSDIITGLQSVNDTVRQQTFNQGLGLAYKPRDSESLSEAILNACRRDYRLSGPVTGEKDVFAGIDVGRVLNIIIRAKDRDGNFHLRAAVQTESFDEAIRLLTQYGVRASVIDALPETRKAREFQRKFARLKVWLSYFNRVMDGTKTEQPARFNAKDLEVDIDRTRAFDGMFALFHNANLRDEAGNPLPGNTLPVDARALPDYYAQLMAPLRVMRENSHAVMVPAYVSNAADHFALAELYCHVASLCPFMGWSRGTG